MTLVSFCKQKPEQIATDIRHVQKSYGIFFVLASSKIHNSCFDYEGACFFKIHIFFQEQKAKDWQCSIQADKNPNYCSKA